jgi:hypothetical protein
MNVFMYVQNTARKCDIYNFFRILVVFMYLIMKVKSEEYAECSH